MIAYKKEKEFHLAIFATEKICKLFSVCSIFFFRPTGQVGRQLAMIGDDINERYSSQFNSMIKSLNLSPDTAYEAFAGIARR